MAFRKLLWVQGLKLWCKQKSKNGMPALARSTQTSNFGTLLSLAQLPVLLRRLRFEAPAKRYRFGGKVVDLTVDQLKSGVTALRAVGVPRSSEARVLEELADDVQALDDANPLRGEPTFDIAASHEHKTRVEAASVAVERNQAPLIPDEPKVPHGAPESVYDSDNLDRTIYRFDPDEIEVDAELFQFKEGGDEFGVTDRLQGITKWMPDQAGTVVVYEYADGRRFIADGHQRLGLAKRIKASDPGKM